MVNVKTRPSNMEDKLEKLSQNSRENVLPTKKNKTNEIIFFRYNLEIQYANNAFENSEKMSPPKNK